MNQKARSLHERALVVDYHVCLPEENQTRYFEELFRYQAAGVDWIFVNVADATMPLEGLVRRAAELRRWIALNPQRCMLVGKVSDAQVAQETGRLGISFNVEGGFSLGRDIAVVQLLYDIGVRWMLMVYNSANAIGCGVHDAEDRGLTAFGYEVIAEMDRVGMIKDCSHTGYRTARDVIDASSCPVTLSHSNALALRDHPRNVPDDLISACAATGGVIGVCGVGLFLNDANDVSTEAVLRHIDYVSDLVGPEHVGIGSDYCDFDPEWLARQLASNVGNWPPGYGYGPGMRFMAPEQFPEITEGLLRRGYSDAAVQGILGGNFRRVASAVWK
jgi:membrane dipeptidase